MNAPILFGLLLVALVAAGESRPARALPTGGGMIRWCLVDPALDQILCCGPWVEYGAEPLLTEAQANNQAWDDFRNSGCPGVGPDGSDPPYVLGGTGSVEVDPYLVVGPSFDASGDDGILFSLGDGAVSWNTAWSPLTPTSSGLDSAYVDINASGLGAARYSDAGGGQFKLDADLSGTGVPYQVRLYSGGVFVASGPFQLSGRVGDILSGGWPQSASAGAGGSPRIGLAWSSPISFLIRGDATPTICDSLAIVAVNGNTTALTSVHMTLKNMDALALTQLDNGIALSAEAVPSFSTLQLIVLVAVVAGLGAIVLRRLQSAAA